MLDYVDDKGDNETRRPIGYIDASSKTEHKFILWSHDPSENHISLTDEELLQLRNRFDSYFKSPSIKSIQKITDHAKRPNYKRLCWQLAGCLVGSLAIDAILLIALIKLI